MATRITPTALKFMKFCTGEVMMKRIPSAVSSPRTAMVTCSTWSVAGSITS